QLSDADRNTMAHLYRQDVAVTPMLELVQRLSYLNDQTKRIVLAMQQEAKQDHTAAINTLNESIKLDPQTSTPAKAWLLMAMCYSTEHQFEEAERCYKTALGHPQLSAEDKPSLIKAYAWLLRQEHRDDEAAQLEKRLQAKAQTSR